MEGVDDYKIYITLNSNLILLIPNDLALFQLIDTYFKFQSDSINTQTVIQTITSLWNFKFQSDSINTERILSDCLR